MDAAVDDVARFFIGVEQSTLHHHFIQAKDIGLVDLFDLAELRVIFLQGSLDLGCIGISMGVGEGERGKQYQKQFKHDEFLSVG